MKRILLMIMMVLSFSIMTALSLNVLAQTIGFTDSRRDNCVVLTSTSRFDTTQTKYTNWLDFGYFGTDSIYIYTRTITDDELTGGHDSMRVIVQGGSPQVFGSTLLTAIDTFYVKASATGDTVYTQVTTLSGYFPYFRFKTDRWRVTGQAQDTILSAQWVLFPKPIK